MKNVVFIIGNGFDLSLGHPTSYIDFLKSNQFQNLIYCNSLCKYLLHKYDNSNWIDIENALAEYSLGNECNHSTFFTEFCELKQALTDYIKSIPIDITQKKHGETAAFQVLMQYCLQALGPAKTAHVSIIDFNYTNSARKAIDSVYHLGNITFTSPYIKLLYDIPLRIIHPHGLAKDDNIILGVEDDAKIYKTDSFLRKSCDPNYNLDFSPSLFSNCDELIVFGHSLGNTDHTYFKDFFIQQSFVNAKSKTIKIYFKGNDGRNKIISQLDILTNHNMQKFRQINEFSLVDVDEFSLSEAIEYLTTFIQNISNIYKTLKTLLLK